MPPLDQDGREATKNTSKYEKYGVVYQECHGIMDDRKYDIDFLG